VDLLLMLIKSIGVCKFGKQIRCLYISVPLVSWFKFNFRYINYKGILME
jgi:hypothetical protein